jgi:two-component system chemotaxis response regulator CheY
MSATILVIDDDPNIREQLGIHLRNAGYEVFTAADGIDGGHAILRRPPDLIVTDAEMPHMDGFELIAALRGDTSLPPIPVIMLTSQAEWEERGSRIGVEGYVTKPVRADTLLSLIERHLPRV